MDVKRAVEHIGKGKTPADKVSALLHTIDTEVAAIVAGASLETQRRAQMLAQELNAAREEFAKALHGADKKPVDDDKPAPARKAAVKTTKGHK